MSTILSRIAVAAPFAAVVFGLGIGAAHAESMEISEHSQVEPKPDVADKFENGDPENEPEDEPVDPPAEPADEPADEPSEDDSEESDEESAPEPDQESDEESDEAAEDEDTDRPTRSVPAFDKVTTSSVSDVDEAGTDDETVEAFRTTATELTPPSQGRPGVHVPVLALAAGGATVAGVAGWAGYRRHRIFTS